MKKTNQPNFSGKCLSMSIKDDKHNHDLLNPYFEYQGDKLFIIGTIPKGATESDWSEDKIGAVAWDRVTNYVIFDDLKEYKKGIKKSEDFYLNEKKKKKK